jgi:autotransporter adhesin
VQAGRIAQGSKDAVNGGQIWALEEAWDINWTQINRRVDGLSDRIDAVGAQAAAMSMMNGAGQYLPVGKVAITAGWGRYGSQSAFAVGAKFRATERTSWSIGLSKGSEGKTMAGVGFAFTLN